MPITTVRLLATGQYERKVSIFSKTEVTVNILSDFTRMEIHLYSTMNDWLAKILTFLWTSERFRYTLS